MKNLAFLIFWTLIASVGCKKSSSPTTGSSEISSVTIQVPSAVAGKIDFARLRSNTAVPEAAHRTFESQVNAATQGDSVIGFQMDNEKKDLAVNDNLKTVTLELLLKGKVIYSGEGDIKEFIIKSGENPITFSLKCLDKDTCPTGSNIEFVQIQGVSAEAGKAPSILARIKIDGTGTTTLDKRNLLKQCKAEVSKYAANDCDFFKDKSVGNFDGRGMCQAIMRSDPDSIPDGYGTGTIAQLDDSLSYCEKLGILRKK